MSENHLSEEELDLVLCGEELSPERSRHLAGCAECGRRRETFLAAVRDARSADPDRIELAEARHAAIERWTAHAGGQRRLRWWLAAAAVLLLALLPLFRHGSSRPEQQAQHAQQPFNAEQVLTEVDAMLQQDPLTSMASEAVVDTVVPVDNVSWEGGA